MGKTKKAGIIATVIVPILVIVGVGDYYFDFSNTQNIDNSVDNSQTTINQNTVIHESGFTCGDALTVCDNAFINTAFREVCEIAENRC